MVTRTKLTTTAIGILFLGSLFTMMATKYYYTRHMPAAPEAQYGRTIPITANYGKVVYVNHIEKQRLQMLYAAALIAGALFTLSVAWSVKNCRSNFRP
jgi:hypothetical protein